MKFLRSIFYVVVLFLFAVITGCSSSPDWNTTFVVWNGDMYEISNEYVDEIDEEIGKVTKYSDREGIYSGNFSNKYRKGTKFYSIKDIDPDEAIAIEEDGKYRKAINNGTYGK